ncbi:MAG: sulfatase [Bryobacteraceae bacterium]
MVARLILTVLILAALSACGGSSGPGVTRLVDRFKTDMVKNTQARKSRPKPAGLWNFAEANATAPDAKPMLGWTAGVGVSGLALKDGRLKGHTTTDFPIIYVERPGKDETDSVHSIEIRLKANKGTNLMVSTQGAADLKFPEILDRAKGLKQPWAFSSPMVAGDNMQTIVLRNAGSTRLSGVRKLLIRPSDAEGADFEIESVRIISVSENLANIPSGIGWQGMSEIYRESLISRSPETIEMQVKLPAKPWLDLHVGTFDESPVTFQVSVDGKPLMERTLTTADRWEDASVDLAAEAGKEVKLTLAVIADKEGALGLWGGPVIRDRSGALPHGKQKPKVDLSGGRVPQGIIFIVSDTTRRDHLNFNGYGRETAPTLSKLASQGARFADNVSQATWTKVSFPTIMTSLYSSTNRVKETQDALPVSAVTMAEVFRDAGYATVAYSSVAFHGKLTNLHKGWEEFHERSSVAEAGSKTARTYVDRLSDWLGQHREEPFFVVLHVFDAHPPFEPRHPYDALWTDPSKRDQYMKDVDKLKTFIKNPGDRDRVMPSLEELRASGLNEEEVMGRFIGWYDGSIRGLDSEVARLMLRLKTLGLADKTVLALTADHGEEFHEHGHMWHGQTVYGELTNVPLMFYGPGFLPSGVVIGQTTQNVDIMPTLLDISHLAPPKNIQGQSLLPLMAAAKEAGTDDPAKLRPIAERYGWTLQPAFSEKAMTEKTGGPLPYDTESYSMVYDGWKLIHNSKRPEGTPEYELYDHRKDPLNQKNVAGENAEVLKKLTPKLEERRKSAIASALPPTAPNSKMNAEELQRLRSLGYVQ